MFLGPFIVNATLLMKGVSTPYHSHNTNLGIVILAPSAYFAEAIDASTFKCPRRVRETPPHGSHPRKMLGRGLCSVGGKEDLHRSLFRRIYLHTRLSQRSPFRCEKAGKLLLVDQKHPPDKRGIYHVSPLEKQLRQSSLTMTYAFHLNPPTLALASAQDRLLCPEICDLRARDLEEIHGA